MSAARVLAEPLEHGLPLEHEAPVGPVPRHVEIVPDRQQHRRRPRVRYAVVAIGGIFAILLAQLLMSMLVAEGAYRIAGLQDDNKELARDVQMLTEEQQRLSSTQNLVANAAALGMVSDSNRVFLRLSDGAVLGTPVPAGTGDVAVDAGAPLVANALVEGLAPVVAATPEAPAAGTADAGAPPVDPAAGNVASEVEGLPSPVTR